MTALVGILVGGLSRRMGGRPKGLLRAPGGAECLVEKLVRAALEAGMESVLVGNAVAYDGVLPAVPRIADKPLDIGPLGGLGALLDAAGEAPAIALGCDMPFVSVEILGLLASHRWRAPVVAPRSAPDAAYEPLLTRYDARRVAPVLQSAIERGVRSFRGVLALLEIEELELTDTQREALRDWDCPEDIVQSGAPMSEEGKAAPRDPVRTAPSRKGRTTG